MRTATDPLSTGAMGAAHCEKVTRSIIPAFSKRFSSAATLSLYANGTGRALQNRGCESGLMLKCQW